MRVEVKSKDAWSLLPTNILFQTAFWSHVKAQLGWRPHAFDLSSSDLAGDVLVLTKAFTDGVTAAYVPQGPEHGPSPDQYGSFLEELSDALSDHLESEVSFIRYDLPWKSQYAADLDRDASPGVREGRPEARLREMRMNFGTKSWNLRKAPMDLTVADTLTLDLAGREEEILSRMKPKTRYNIHLAERKGVRVLSASIDMLPVFYDLYRQTAERNGFPPSGFEHFSALFSALSRRIDSSEVHLLLATHNDEVLAGAVLAVSGRVATYLFGASSNRNRNLMGSYAVQWNAMLLAKAKGCLTYDMGAVSPTKTMAHPFYGMYRFKMGFGGQIIHRTGSWDYPLDSDGYTKFRNAEMLGAGLS